MTQTPGSIRATLLFWQAVVLVTTVAAFATFLYSSRVRGAEETFDDRIATQVAAIAAAAEDDEEDGVELELSDQFLASFRGGDDAPYFVVWDRTGTVSIAAGGAVDVPLPEGEGFRDRGDLREAARAGADGLKVLVGASTARLAEQHREFLVLLVGVGITVLLLALVGGWLLSGRVLAPIRRMSAAAAEISDTDPTRRLDVGRTETELGLLAGTLNEAFDRMQDAVDRRSRFTADASHELRTPVSVVLATAEQTLRRERGGAEYREALETVLRAGRRMKELVDDLLTLTRIDAGDLALERRPVELGPLVSEVLDLLRPLAEERDLTLERAGEEDAVALGDRERLREVVTNLVQNAIRYNRAEGHVTVSLRSAGDRVELAVSDTGIGIAPEHRDGLFERFYRVDEARSRRDGGSGLGLSIVSSIVSSHSGTIDVESTPGRGTTFTVGLTRSNERSDADGEARSARRS